MAQHDYVIANGTGAAVRSDLNNGLSAIVSQNSGATAPATTYAYMTWADTTAGVMKMRNGANNAWITLYQLDGEWSTIAFENGSAAAPSIYFKDSGTDTGIYSPGADQVAISTGGTARLTTTTTGITSALAVDVPLGAVGTPSITFTGDTNTGIYSPAADTLAFVEGGVEALRIDSSGRVGIGVTGPSSVLEIASDSTPQFKTGMVSNAARASLMHNGSDLYLDTTAGALVFRGASNAERGRFDSSGRLLVGTSSASVFTYGGITPRLQVEGTDGSTGALSVARNSNDSNAPGLIISKSRGTSAGSNTIVQNNDTVGDLRFEAADGTQKVIAASIGCIVDGTPGANDMPSRLVFSTTADGASSPTERMRIDSVGAVLFKKTTKDYTTEGTIINQGAGSGSDTSFVTAGGAVATFARSTNDGTIISLRQDGTEEGTISVSGTTVSYNGAHLSRWSQLPTGAEREEILRGTVLSNIDEMCEWDEEDNEQLNRMKVSDVEGDKNVSGVFQAWDDDDDTYTNDFYCAMTGDFIIRIAESVTVQRGDLLMSAGDGTAKPQDDDIIRSKTVAKVTSTNVSCTYEDGSYCVPCVLMAC